MGTVNFDSNAVASRNNPFPNKDGNVVTLRSSAVLTTAYVASDELDVLNYGSVVIQFALTDNGQTSISFKIEESGDGTNWFVVPRIEGLSAGDYAIKSGVFTATNSDLDTDPTFSIAVDVNPYKMIRVSALYTGGSAPTLAITAYGGR